MQKTNKKIVAFIFIVLAVGLYYTFTTKEFSEEVREVTQEEFTQVSEVTATKRLKTNSVKVKKNNIVQKEINTSVDIDKIVISMMAIDENLTNLVAGKSIEVKNFYDEEKLLSYFTPYFSDEYIVGLSISRVYTVKKEVGRMIKIDKKWTSYPPVTLSDASVILIEKYPSFDFHSRAGFFYLDDRVTPYYLFETLGEKKSFYLVNAYNKSIIIKKSRTLDKEEKEDISALLEIDMDGFLHIKEEFFDTLSEEEKIQTKKEIDETNDYIKKGLMKFDKEMNVILDKRPLNGVSISENTLSSDESNDIIESDFDNRKSITVEFENLE